MASQHRTMHGVKTQNTTRRYNIELYTASRQNITQPYNKALHGVTIKTARRQNRTLHCIRTLHGVTTKHCMASQHRTLHGVTTQNTAWRHNTEHCTVSQPRRTRVQSSPPQHFPSRTGTWLLDATFYTSLRHSSWFYCTT